MKKSIDVSDTTFARLEKLAVGFDTPEAVIIRLLDKAGLDYRLGQSGQASRNDSEIPALSQSDARSCDLGPPSSGRNDDKGREKTWVNSWPDESIERTRETLANPLDTAHSYIDNLHMKNINGTFGVISTEDHLNMKYCIKERNGKEHNYTSCDDLVASGWIID